MLEILIVGVIQRTEYGKSIYRELVDACKSYASKIHSPLDPAAVEGTDQERYERAFSLVRQADLLIAEHSMPSTGMGMELREAALLDKPILVVARNGSAISGLIGGCPQVRAVLMYEDAADMRAKVGAFLASYESR